MTLRATTLSAILFALAPLALGQTPNLSTTSQQYAVNKPRGFFDFILGKINPSGNDYGVWMQSGRDAVVTNTIDDLYFWSNTVTLLLLTGSVTMILLQWKSEAKREVITAALITELLNGRVSDGIEIARRSDQFNQLVATHNAEVEKALALKQQAGTEKQSGNLNRSVRKLTETGSGTGRKPIAADVPIVEPGTAAAPDESPANVQQANLLLQRRIEAMQNTQQNLERRLSQTSALLDQERRRNASLKGA